MWILLLVLTIFQWSLLGSSNAAYRVILAKTRVIFLWINESLRALPMFHQPVHNKALNCSSPLFAQWSFCDQYEQTACDMVMWYWSADTLFWQLSINYNMDVQYQRCTYGISKTVKFIYSCHLTVGKKSTTNILQTLKVIGTRGSS